MVAAKRQKLAMETNKKRKARLEKMVATTQLRLALETEEEIRAKMDWIKFVFNLDWDWSFKNSRNELALPVMGTIVLVSEATVSLFVI